MLDLSVAKKVDPSAGVQVSFEIAPADLYPQTAAYLAQILDEGGAVPANLAQHLEEARAAGFEALGLVDVSAAECPPDLLGLRAAGLEACRRYFTEALHASVGYAKMHLRILVDDTYRLRPR